jgi:hypothetical protein
LDMLFLMVESKNDSATFTLCPNIFVWSSSGGQICRTRRNIYACNMPLLVRLMTTSEVVVPL